ncbi:MAG TPA: response regulator [Kofleriaceae bacterium]|nr:response regulator [Kofleriaceae bacterium]
MSLPHRVLVVDDDPEIRETMVEVLNDEGYEAIGACDGYQALEQLRDPEDRWCLVLLDLMMPNMDGRTFRAEQLRDPALAPIPVVIVSAMNDVAATAEELQVSAHMTKPIPLRALIEMVRRFCAGS